jgi:hypothetical protein
MELCNIVHDIAVRSKTTRSVLESGFILVVLLLP